MKRIVFHAPDEMEEAIRNEARTRRAPISAVIRQALEEYFKRQGITFETHVEWGKPTEENEDPAEMAVAAS